MNSTQASGDAQVPAGPWPQAVTARLRELLAIPFVAVVYSVERDDGEWYRRAEYPELPGCAVEAPSAREAMDRLEDMRVEVLTAAALAGEEIDTTREPLQAGVSGLSDQPIATLLRGLAAAETADGDGMTGQAR